MNKSSTSNVRRFDCAGSCGKFQMVRPSKVQKADYYVCNSECAARLPSPAPGQIKVLEFGACGAFKGITHRFPSAEEARSIERSQAIAVAGQAQLALLKAKRALD